MKNYIGSIWKALYAKLRSKERTKVNANINSKNTWKYFATSSSLWKRKISVLKPSEGQLFCEIGCRWPTREHLIFFREPKIYFLKHSVGLRRVWPEWPKYHRLGEFLNPWATFSGTLLALNLLFVIFLKSCDHFITGWLQQLAFFGKGRGTGGRRAPEVCRSNPTRQQGVF